MGVNALDRGRQGDSTGRRLSDKVLIKLEKATKEAVEMQLETAKIAIQ